MERITNCWYFGIAIVFAIAGLLKYTCHMSHRVIYESLCVLLGFTATPV